MPKFAARPSNWPWRGSSEMIAAGTRKRSAEDIPSSAVSASPAALFDRDDHRVRTRERLDAGLREPGLAHPRLAVGSGKVETARRLDQHVQAHQQTECVLAPLVIDDRLIDNKRAAVGKRGMRLFEQHALLRKIPVVQNMAHDKDIGWRQGVREEVSAKKFYPLLHSMLGYEFLKDRLDFGQVVSGARKMVMRAGDGNWHHALCRADVDERLIILPREFRGDCLRG